MTANGDKRWRVGELAHAAGLTIRTLHHYDEIGLLVPSERTSSGYRLYSPTDLQRLYRITFLRRLGVPLQQIAQALDGETWQLEAVLRQHAQEAERQLELQHRLRRRLLSMLAASQRSDNPSADQFIDTMEVMTLLDKTATDIHEISIAAPPERVWQALTDPEMTRMYYLESTVESDWRPGSPLIYRSPSGDPWVQGEVLEINPPRRLVSTFDARWRAEVVDDPPSKVVWDIEPNGAGSTVRIEHFEILPGSATHGDSPSGFARILGSLKTLLEEEVR